MPAMLGWILVALAESQLKILAPLHTWSYSVADNSYIHARATLPSPRLHGAARGLRARSAPRAATGALVWFEQRSCEGPHWNYKLYKYLCKFDEQITLESTIYYINMLITIDPPMNR